MEIRERLAALAHEQWSGWMKYVFKQCNINSDESATIPGHLVRRWKRQIRTPYSGLMEYEKDSDRKEADRVLHEIEQALGEIIGVRDE